MTVFVCQINLSTQSVRTVSYNLANAKVDDFVGVVQAYIYTGP
jgi:hypothetical protein